MTPERWRCIEAIFSAVSEAAPEAQAALLTQACQGDATLRAEVEVLLRNATIATTQIQSVLGHEALLLAREAAPLASNRRIGPYRLLRELGQGGMGAVYLAARDDNQYLTEVALKVLHHGLETARAVARFRDERQILATLDHPGIVRLLDGGTTDDGLPYLVMEHVHGTPLVQYVEAQRLPLRARLALFRKVCAAIAYAHSKLIVHRDVKPSNILVTRDGEPKLLDFGIAKLLDSHSALRREAATRTGTILLTPQYASPEQVRGEPTSIATDVYSLGVVLYELVSGTQAHPLPAPGQDMSARANGWPRFDLDVPRPSAVAPAALRRQLAGDLDNIILKAMHRDPALRYASAEQLSADVGRHLAGLPVHAHAATPWYRARKFVVRNRALLAVLALIVGSLSTATAISLRAAHLADRQARRADAQARRADAQARRADIEARQAREEARRARNATRLAAARERQGDPTTALALLREIEPGDVPAGWAEQVSWVRGVGVATTVLVHDTVVLDAAFSPDGQSLLTGAADGIVRLWPLAAAAPPRRLQAHTGEVLKVSFSPSGRWVASASRDHTVCVWDLRGERAPMVLRGHIASVGGLAWSPDETHIASGSQDHTVRIWHIDGAAPPRVLRGHRDGVSAVAWSADGKHVLSAARDQTVRLWNTDTSSGIRVLKGPGPLFSAAVSRDDKHIVTATEKGQLDLWDTAHPASSRALAGHTHYISRVAFSPDGHQLASASYDRTVRIWNADASGSGIVLRPHDDLVNSVAFSPDGRRIATASWDKTARITALVSPDRPLVLRGHPRAVYCASFSPDGNRVVSGGIDGTLQVWDGWDASGRPPAKVTVLRGHQGLVYAASFSPDGKRIVTASADNTVRVWNADGSGTPLILRGHSNLVIHAAFSHDGRRIVSASYDKTVRVWNADGSGFPRVLEGHTDLVFSAAFSPDDKLIVSGSWDHTLRFWYADGSPGAPFPPRRCDDRILSLAISPDGNTIVTGSTNGRLYVWRIGRQGPPLVLDGGPGLVNVAGDRVFTPDSKHFISSTNDGTVRLWDLDGNPSHGPRVLRLSKEAINSVAFSPDGQHLIAASDDKTVILWSDLKPVQSPEDPRLWPPPRIARRLRRACGCSVFLPARPWSICCAASIGSRPAGVWPARHIDDALPVAARRLTGRYRAPYAPLPTDDGNRMNLDRIALFTVLLSSGVGLIRVLRAKTVPRGWAVVFTLLLVLGGAAWRWPTGWGGLAVAAAWTLLVLIPALASRRVERAMRMQDFGRARRAAWLVRALHPADGWREQLQLLDALERAARGDLRGAMTIFTALRARGAAGIATVATVHLLRMSARWDELRDWIEKQYPADALARDLSLLGNYLRALGETRGPEAMASAWQRFAPTLDTAPPMELDSIRLFLFVFTGRRDLVQQLLTTRFSDLPASIHRFWLATADLAAGRGAAAATIFERLRADGDPNVQIAVSDRLTRSLPVQAATLSPAACALVERVARQLDEEERYSEHSATARAVRPYTIYALAALISAVFVIEWVLGGTTSPEVLWRLGAFMAPAIWEGGQWWRLFMFTLLHLGPVHLVMNLVGLTSLGPFVERALGPARLLFVWLLSSVGGGVVGLGLWLADMAGPHQLLVGASGGVMGLVGATAAVLLRGWRHEQAQVARRRLIPILIIIAVQVLFDLTTPEVSFMAHASGLVLGFVTALPMHARIARRRNSSDKP